MVWKGNRDMKNEIDNVIPKANWEFDQSVADCFENMLSRSIPQYDVMRSSVSNLVRDVLNSIPIKQTFQILDVGCSDGLMLESMIKQFEPDRGYFYGIDVSEPMLAKARERFQNEQRVRIMNHDVTKSVPAGYFDVITSVLTLQFIPINYRQQIIQQIYERLSPVNGCFIFVEKVLGSSAYLDELFIKNYHEHKKENGYSAEDIERKRMSLEGVLVPVTSDWNIDLMKQAGFRHIDTFWRWMNFVGYIAIK